MYISIHSWDSRWMCAEKLVGVFAHKTFVEQKMFKAGWALLEQIKIDTLPYCFLKYSFTMHPACRQQLPHASTAPLRLAVPKPGSF